MFTVKLIFTDNQIMGLLCDAFEGGVSSNWITEVKMGRKPTVPGPKASDDNYWHWSQWVPVHGGSLKIRVLDDDQVYTLDGKAIAEGIQKFAEECPSNFGDFMNENDDAFTGDGFLQCCLFGEWRYS